MKKFNFFIILATLAIFSGCDDVAVTGVSLNKKNMLLAVGTSEKLLATIEPINAGNQSVTWKSSDNSIATVAQDGTVTAVSLGLAFITVKTDDGEKTAMCSVLVIANLIPAESITLDKSTHSLLAGENFTLAATVVPINSTDNVEWQTSNAAVATVSNGLVTARATGTVIITAKAGDKTAACEVTVTATAIPAESIALDRSTHSLFIDENFTLTATVLPANSTDKVEWQTSNATVATVSNGLVTARAAGTATVTAKAGDKTASCIVTVTPNISTFDNGVVINGVKWATRNIAAPGQFADRFTDAGMLYQWNRKIGWSATDPRVNSNGGTTWDDSFPEGTEWTAANDPSPAGWRVPTKAQLETLLDADNVTNEWSTQDNGVEGRLFRDIATGNTLFLPAVDTRYGYGGTLSGYGTTFGYYWSSTLLDSSNSYYLYFNTDYANMLFFSGNGGYSVRSVAAE